MDSDDILDLQAARECLSEYTQLSSKSDSESLDMANECMMDANCCVQAIVLRGNVKSNPFNELQEKELYDSFEDEMHTLGLHQ